MQSEAEKGLYTTSLGCSYVRTISMYYLNYLLKRYHLQTRGKCSFGAMGIKNILAYTGKSLSEALIFASTNPQYDDRLFSGAGTGGARGADQLTLFQPWGADSAHPLLVAPSMFFTFRHH